MLFRSVPPVLQTAFAEIHGGGGEPAALVAFILESDLGRHGADKGILGAVFGIGSIFEESKADPVDGPVVPQIEGFKIGRYGRYFPSVR